MALAQAARRGDRLRFDYRPATTARAGATSSRTASCRCATAGTSSRSTSIATTGGRTASTASGRPCADRLQERRRDRPRTPPRSSPRASRCGSTTSRRASASRCRADVVAREIAPTVAVIQPAPPDATSTTVLMGGDLDFIATYLASLPFPFEVLDPPAVRDRGRRPRPPAAGLRRTMTSSGGSVESAQVEALAATEHRQRAVRRHDEHERRRARRR